MNNSSALRLERLRKLEKQLDELSAACAQLREDNRLLQARQESLVSEKMTLLEKTELVQGRVEAMVSRLKALEPVS